MKYTRAEVDAAVARAVREATAPLLKTLEAYAKAAEKFVLKVDTGAAKSKQTYAELKACLAMDHGERSSDGIKEVL